MEVAIAADLAFSEMACAVREARVWIDVRSEGEFAQGHFPHTVNLPILNNEERHLVGWTYKNKGPELARQKGHELVDPQRAQRVGEWCRVAGSSPHPARVMCWRGGLRSQISQEWMAEAGHEVARIKGGYQALRNEALKELQTWPDLLVISGMTGTGKTDLLRPFARTIDLEELAVHRGSAFGGWSYRPQPTQATFENFLAIRKRELAGRELWLEDESRLIGKIAVPKTLVEKLSQSPVVEVTMNLEQRAHRVYEEYVVQALSRESGAELHTRFLKSLEKIWKHLGGELAARVREQLTEAFSAQEDLRRREMHLAWIQGLLEHYYDKRYAYSMAKLQRPILFRGSPEECQAWLRFRGGELSGEISRSHYP